MVHTNPQIGPEKVIFVMAAAAVMVAEPMHIAFPAISAMLPSVRDPLDLILECLPHHGRAINGAKKHGNPPESVGSGANKNRITRGHGIAANVWGTSFI